jgi:hypothetical protein
MFLLKLGLFDPFFLTWIGFNDPFSIGPMNLEQVAIIFQDSSEQAIKSTEFNRNSIKRLLLDLMKSSRFKEFSNFTTH